MLKENIHYEDFNGAKREVTLYFYLNEKEITDLQAHSEHGIQYEMEEAINSNNAGRVLDFITNLVHLSFGHKSQDGKNFVKSPEILQEFVSAAYYSDFLMGLIQDNGVKGQEFIQGIMPKKLVDRAMAQSQGQPVDSPDRTVYESTVVAPSAREVFAERTQQVQPTPPSQFQPASAPTPVPSSPPADPEYQAYLLWKEQQAQAKAQEQTDQQSQTQLHEPIQINEKTTPAYRVPANEEEQSHLPRPVHEQNSANPQQ